MIDASNPKTNKWPVEESRKRVESYILPGPALAGLPCREGTDGDDNICGQDLAHIIAYCKAGGRFERLKSVLPPSRERYTVTLRQSANLSHRNSEQVAWRVFAADIGAYVIEDYDVKPISLHERMALYAGAEMNFGVLNGPVALCHLADYPVMIFRADSQAKLLRSRGVKDGGKFPWMLPHQHLIWQDDMIDSLRWNFAMLKHAA